MPEAPWRLQLAPFTERARKASQGAAHPPVSAAAVSGRGREVRASQSATAAGSRQRDRAVPSPPPEDPDAAQTTVSPGLAGPTAEARYCRIAGVARSHTQALLDIVHRSSMAAAIADSTASLPLSGQADRRLPAASQLCRQGTRLCSDCPLCAPTRSTGQPLIKRSLSGLRNDPAGADVTSKGAPRE